MALERDFLGSTVWSFGVRHPIVLVLMLTPLAVSLLAVEPLRREQSSQR